MTTSELDIPIDAEYLATSMKAAFARRDLIESETGVRPPSGSLDNLSRYGIDPQLVFDLTMVGLVGALRDGTYLSDPEGAQEKIVGGLFVVICRALEEKGILIPVNPLHELPC